MIVCGLVLGLFVQKKIFSTDGRRTYVGRTRHDGNMTPFWAKTKLFGTGIKLKIMPIYPKSLGENRHKTSLEKTCYWILVSQLSKAPQARKTAPYFH